MNTLEKKKWLKERRRANKIKRQHNYETKTLKRWRFAPPEKDGKEVKE